MQNQTIPNVWTHAKISDISIKGFQRKPLIDENFTYVDIGSIDRSLKQISEPQVISGENAPSRARKVIENGDVLVSLTRPNLNAVALVNQKYHNQIASTGFEVIKPVLADSRYIFALVRSKEFVDQISGVVQGALYPAAKSSDVQNFEFPLPPLAEQKVITDKLDTLLAQVENTKARLEHIPKTLKRFHQSVLAAAVSGRLTEEWRGTKALVGWEENELTQFTEKPRYGSSAKSQKTGDTPVLRMGNLQDGQLDWTDLVYTSDPEEIEKYHLEPGDILFNRTNSPELVGKTSIFRGERDAIYAGYLIKITCLPSLNPEFLNYQLNSPKAKDYCKSVKSDGVSQSNINAKKLAAYPLNCPPLEEQTEIVRQVDQLFAHADRVEQQINNALARINNLTQSILAKAFRGELTEQWRKDNPELISGANSAEALLERIKAERDVLSKKTRSKISGSKKKTDRNMKTPTREELIGYIESIPAPQFSFNEIVNAFEGDYEKLKECFFALLSDNQPVIEQRFDSNAGKVVFIKVEK
jgi:type I restriction enzyme S subunit